MLLLSGTEMVSGSLCCDLWGHTVGNAGAQPTVFKELLFSQQSKCTLCVTQGKMEQSLGKGIRRKTKGHISNLKSKTLERCFQIIRFNRWARQHAQPLTSLTYHTNLRRAYHCWNPGRAGLCAAAAVPCQGDKASLPWGHGGWKKLLQDQLNWNVWRQERQCPKILLKVYELTAQMVQRDQMPWNEATCVSLAHAFCHPLPWKAVWDTWWKG